MTHKQIPAGTAFRLAEYSQLLAQLHAAGRPIIASRELGEAIGVTPAQVRKDLSYFGHFGKRGSGYPVPGLNRELRHLLGLDHCWRLALVGVGVTGRAMLHNPEFRSPPFEIVDAFDIDPAVVGERVAGLVVAHVGRMEEILRAAPVEIGLVAVPPVAAQEIIDQLIASGIRAILSFASIAVHVPPDVALRQIGPLLLLGSLSYSLCHPSADAGDPGRAAAGSHIELGG